MTLEQLLTLKTIVSAGSFRSASEKLHKAQSALSYSIKNLEEEVGFKLFNRSVYRPTLTAQGKAFLKKAEQTLESLDELKSTSQFLKQGYEPQIKIVVSALIPLPLVAECLREFQAVYPNTELKIQQDVLSADQQLLEGHADLAFGELFFDEPQLKCKRLFTIRMVPVCSSKHVLARQKGKAEKKDLEMYPQIVVSSTLKGKDRQAGIENKGFNLSVSDFHTKLAFIKEGLGWGYLPEHLVSSDLSKKQLTKTHDKAIQVPMFLAFNAKTRLGPCGQFIWDYFSPAAKKA